MRLVVTFHSVSAALYLDKLMKAEERKCKIVPVPRALSSSCGYAAVIEGEEPEAVKDYMNTNETEWEEIYLYDENEVYNLFASA